MNGGVTVYDMEERRQIKAALLRWARAKKEMRQEMTKYLAGGESTKRFRDSFGKAAHAEAALLSLGTRLLKEPHA